jgi:uncharacterized protein YecE (DUF72 family)
MKEGSNSNPSSRSGCRLYVGTSGYSHTDWSEAGFYPPGTAADRMLSLYTRRFATTELTACWYQLPRAETVERHRQQAPPDFLFAVKLTRCLTHEIDARRWPELAGHYREGIAPLVQAGQLAAILVQLPPAFDRTPTHRRHLAALLDALRGLPLAVEFHHCSWISRRVLEELQHRRISLVIVDGPDLPDLFPVWETVTNPDLFYVRFYGRNTRGWRSEKAAARFDYCYSEDELRRWAEERIVPLSRRARRGVLYFANHVRAQAPQNALRLIELLRKEGMTVI